MTKTLAALVLVLLANASSYAQTKGSQAAASPAARCELSNGVKLIAGYSDSTTGPKKSDASGAQIDFYTSANVVSVQSILIPFGIYKAHTDRDSDKWTLTMKQVADDGITPRKPGPEELIRLPMSLTKAPLSSKTFVVSFDRVGGTCILRVNWHSTQASVEFAGRIGDLSNR